MSLRASPWPPGVPCWVDMTAPDVAAAKEFYADVLGWTYAETEAEYGGYAISEVRGSAVAGIGPQQEGAPPAWTLYLSSDDADATAEAITQHGGIVMLPPGDVGELGRMLIAVDPAGAAFGVWQAGSHIGAALVNEPGGLTWEDLRSHDPDTARDFYTAVFGYRTEPMAEAGPDYHTFALPDDDAPLGGMGGMMGAEGQPAHWLVYFAVADAAAAITATERGGGSVLMRDFETPYGRMAGLMDPAGAVFWIVQNDGDGQPDRGE
ncbi:MAG: VOC family protein [Egibacteraceae bacterium]